MTKYIPVILITALFLSACSGGNGGGKYDDYQEPEQEDTEYSYDEESDPSEEMPYEDGR